MNILKKNIKILFLFIFCFLISSFILSGIYYLINLFFINLLIIYFFNLKIGKERIKEPILNSIIFSNFIIIIAFLLSILFFIRDISFQSFLYYIIIFTTSILAIFIGRRKKTSN